MKVHCVRNSQDAAAARLLVREFIVWMKGRYPERVVEIDAYLKTQNFEHQLANLLTYFNPPNGECILGFSKGVPLGVLMMKRISDTDCEMNRMFVNERARGRGLGLKLCKKLIERAREMEYTSMHLSALDRHTEALRLYAKMGFESDAGASEFDNEGVVALKLAL